MDPVYSPRAERTAEFRPFVELLQAARGKEEVLWSCIRHWPGTIQDHAEEHFGLYGTSRKAQG